MFSSQSKSLLLPDVFLNGLNLSYQIVKLMLSWMDTFLIFFSFFCFALSLLLFRIFLNDRPGVIGISAVDATIYQWLVSKSDKFHNLECTADLKNDIKPGFNCRKREWLKENCNTSKMKILSANHYKWFYCLPLTCDTGNMKIRIKRDHVKTPYKYRRIGRVKTLRWQYELE